MAAQGPKAGWLKGCEQGERGQGRCADHGDQYGLLEGSRLSHLGGDEPVVVPGQRSDVIWLHFRSSLRTMC